MNLPIDPVILILAVAFSLALFAYLNEYNIRKKAEGEGNKFLESIKEKGWETLHQSIKKSQDMLGQTELDSIKIEAEYNKKLSEIVSQAENSIKNAYAQFVQFIEVLQKAAQVAQQTTQGSVQTRINQLFDTLEARLSDFLVETSQKTSSSIELELKSARALIDTYKGEQLKLIDENILAMMEQTLAVVLNKKLSLEDQLDLVYEALEKAKVEKFIV